MTQGYRPRAAPTSSEVSRFDTYDLTMFTVTVEREFCAAHALILGGVREVVHGHNFKLAVSVVGPSLDRDGLLVDFHALEKAVDGIIKPFINADLNKIPPFSGVENPSAECIAKYIADQVQIKLTTISGLVQLESVRLTEAPGCSVVYRPTQGSDVSTR